MRLLFKSNHHEGMCLTADVESARRSTLDFEPVVFIETASGREEYFRPCGFDKKEAVNQCNLFIEFVAQEIINRTEIAEIDETAGFRKNEDGSISAKLPLPF